MSIARFWCWVGSICGAAVVITFTYWMCWAISMDMLKMKERQDESIKETIKGIFPQEH